MTILKKNLSRAEARKLLKEALRGGAEAEEMSRKAAMKRMKAHEIIRQLKLRDEERFTKKTGIDLACSDDYAVLDVGDLTFYYGYEYTFCPEHNDEETCYQHDCEKREWCFTVSKEGKEQPNIIIPMSKLWSHPDKLSVQDLLLLGMAQYLQDLRTLLRNSNKGKKND